MENYLEGYESVGVVQGPPVVVPEKKKQSNEMRALYGHTTCEVANNVNSTIFLLGGADVTSQFRPELLEFDSENVACIKQTSDLKNLDHGRFFHSTIVYDNSIYVFGGKGIQVFNEIQGLDTTDPENGTWVKIEPKGKAAPTPRYGHSACRWRNKMVVFGGCDDKERPNNEVFMFDLQQHSWELIASKSPSTPAPRLHHTCVVIHNKMYLFGGRDADNHTWEFDLIEHTWSEIKVKGAKPSARYGHTWTWVGGELAPTLLMFGGAHGKETFDQVWLFNPANNSWKSIPAEKKKTPPPHVHFHSAIVTRHGLLVFGGYDEQNVIGRDFHIIPIRVNVVGMVPEEIIMKVLEKLDLKSVIRSSRVCKQWAVLANDAQVWRAIVLQLLHAKKPINHRALAKDEEGKRCASQEIVYASNSGDDEETTPSEHIKDLPLLPVKSYKKYLKFMKTQKGFEPKIMSSLNGLNDKLKITFIGEAQAGKTTYLVKYFCRVYPKEYIPSVLEVVSVPKVHNGMPVDVILTDVFGGIEGYDRLRPLNYVKTDIFVIMFSLVAPHELQNVKQKWVFESHHHVPDALTMLVGTKADLRNDPNTIQALQTRGQAPITDEQAEALREEIGAKVYLPCSTLHGINVDKVVDTAVGLVLDRILLQDDDRDKKKCAIM